MAQHRVADPPLNSAQRLWFATILTIVLVVVFLVSCSSCAEMKYPLPLPTQMDVAVARMITVKDGKEDGYCTAFKVGDSRIMTAGHCCGTDDDNVDADIDDILGILNGAQPKAKPTMEYHAVGTHAIPGESFRVLIDDDDHDVCVLEGHLHGAPLMVAMHDPDIGAQVFTAGYPKAQFLMSQGLWSGRNSGDQAMASIAVWGGASGSPVMDSDGRVVGVLRAFYAPMSNMAILSAVEWARYALAESYL